VGEIRNACTILIVKPEGKRTLRDLGIGLLCVGWIKLAQGLVQLRAYTVINVRSELLTAVKMSMLFFWIATPGGLVGRYHFTSVLKMETVCSSETLVITNIDCNEIFGSIKGVEFLT
jgi:hypothetical protein